MILNEHVQLLNVFIKSERILVKPDPAKTTGTRRQQQKAETRTLILDAARELFEEHGWDGTTMREVASMAGVGLGTIFSHFPDKGALLIAALLEDLARTDSEILASLPTDAPIKDQIMHVAAAGFGYWCARPALSATLLREMYFITGAWADNRRQETDRFIHFIYQLLESFRDRGEIRSNIDLRVTAEALYTIYVGSLVRAAGDNHFDADALFDGFEAFLDQFMRGIGSQPD